MQINSLYKHKKPAGLTFRDSEGNHDGRTKQSHKAETLIKTILSKYDKTGIITHVAASTAQYGDYTEVNEYQESLNIVIHAQNAFDDLPAKIRAKFGNDPGEFFEFATDPKNMQEMIDLGLANKIAEEIPTKVEIINPVDSDENTK
jgi:phage internal scaffolding protein